MKLLLVAGHGEGDPGAIGNGYKEADLTREVVTKLYDKLKNIYNVTVYDTAKNLYKQRKNGLNFNFRQYDLVLEVHFNSGGGHGCEEEIHAKTEQKAVGKRILANLSAVGFKNRGANRRTDLSNLNGAYKQGANYCYLETCFIDSASDMKLWANKKAEIISAIARGITGETKEVKAMEKFNDIKGHWAEKQINEIAQMGIVNGRPGGKFCPNDNITRAEAAVMIRNVIRYILGK